MTQPTAPQTFYATVVRTTRAAAQAVYDLPDGEVGSDGFTGGEINLWYCGMGEDDFVPFDVGDVIQVTARPMPTALRGHRAEAEPVVSNVRTRGPHKMHSVG